MVRGALDSYPPAPLAQRSLPAGPRKGMKPDNEIKVHRIGGRALVSIYGPPDTPKGLWRVFGPDPPTGPDPLAPANLRNLQKPMLVTASGTSFERGGSKFKGAAMTLNVVSFPNNPLNDIPAMARRFADDVDAAIKAKTDNLPSDPADASDISSSFSTVNSTLSTISGYLDTEVAAIKAKTGNLPASPASSGDVSGILTTAMTESYSADGATMTVAQALYLIRSLLGDFSISGTTLTTKRLDSSHAAATFTLDSSTAPTSITRAT